VSSKLRDISYLTSFKQVFAIYKKVEGVFFWELNSLSNYVGEVISGQLARDQIPSLINNS